ncbi:MAG: sigma-70 family RNA polymerase sigma factor [Cyclobacteriaceae bacterium]
MILKFHPTPDPIPDEQLLVRLQQGDRQALEVLYLRYSPLLLRYFHRLLWRDRQRAQDALQDLFMKIVENPNRIDASRKFSTWIYSTAHNYCKNAWRHQQVRGNAVHPDLVNAHTLHIQTDPSGDSTRFEKALERILAEEGEEARALLSMRYDLELPVADIAAVLQIPEGTVRSRLFNLKSRLAQSLAAYKHLLDSSTM